MSEAGRRLAAVLAADVAGYSRLAGADEERTLARLRALRGDLIDPAIAAHRGRTVKRAGDGTIVEFRSVIDAARCALEVQQGAVERNAGVAVERQILFRIGIHIGDVVGEADGDLMGDGVNIAARLEGICEPGGIVLSDDAYRQVRDRLQEQFIDLGEQELKNIARPVRVFSLSPQNHVTTPANAGVHRPDAATPPGMDPRVRGGGGLETEQKREAAPRLSIVVLPFANIGGDPEQDYFVDGVTESLNHGTLSRIGGSFVIARNTAFTYKGKPVDVTQIGRDLNVLYVLEGSVQRGGNRLRVNVQLIDAETGNHLWAERFDKPVADLFDMQDEIVARLANTLGHELVRAEAERSARSANLDAIDLTMQGWAARRRLPLTEERFKEVRQYFDRALAIDPRHVEAMTAIASLNVAAMNAGWIERMDEALAEMHDLIDRANATQLGYAHAYVVKSAILFTERKWQEAIEAAQTAIALNPNMAAGYGMLGHSEWPFGLYEQAIAHIGNAMRLSPRDPNMGMWHTDIGAAEFCLDHDDASIESVRRGIDAGLRVWIPYSWLAAAYAWKGDREKAAAAVVEATRQVPNLTVKWIERWNPCPARYAEGLRMAGLPDG